MRYRYLLRVLVVLPPLVLTLTALRVMAMSPLDFSSDFDGAGFVPRWVLSVSPFIVATPVVLVGAYAALSAMSQSRQRFSVSLLPYFTGLFGLVVISVGMHHLGSQDVGYVFGDRALFGDSLLSEQSGSVGSLATTIFGALILGGIVMGFGLIYDTGVVSEGSGKYDKRPGETDGVGELISEMKGR